MKYHHLSCVKTMIRFVILLSWLLLTGTDGKGLPLERSGKGKNLPYPKMFYRVYILKFNNIILEFYHIISFTKINSFLQGDATCQNLQTWCDNARPNCEQIFVKEQCKKYCGLCGTGTSIQF